MHFCHPYIQRLTIPGHHASDHRPPIINSGQNNNFGWIQAGPGPRMISVEFWAKNFAGGWTSIIFCHIPPMNPGPGSGSSHEAEPCWGTGFHGKDSVGIAVVQRHPRDHPGIVPEISWDRTQQPSALGENVIWVPNSARNIRIWWMYHLMHFMSPVNIWRFPEIGLPPKNIPSLRDFPL